MSAARTSASKSVKWPLSNSLGSNTSNIVVVCLDLRLAGLRAFGRVTVSPSSVSSTSSSSYYMEQRTLLIYSQKTEIPEIHIYLKNEV